MSDPISNNTVLYFDSPLFRPLEDKIKYAFLTRQGKLSDGTSIEMDISLRPSNKTNSLLLYQLLTHSFGILQKKHIFLSQPHKSEIAVIKDTPSNSFFSGYDAVITTNRDIILNILTADCVCLLITNKPASFIAAVHCGWKSFHDNIISKIIEKFTIMKINPDDLLISLSPAIQVCCYEVKEEIRYKIRDILGNSVDKVFKESGNKLYFNLPGAITEHLIQCGIPGENISVNEKCTSCEKDLFYSYRRDSREYRLLNFISLANDIQKNI